MGINSNWVSFTAAWNHNGDYARGSIYTTIMELGPKNHNGDGLLGSNSIMAVYMDCLGMQEFGLRAYVVRVGLLGYTWEKLQ